MKLALLLFLLVPLVSSCGQSSSSDTNSSAGARPAPISNPAKDQHPATLSVGADCGTVGSVEERLKDCARAPDTQLGKWSVLTRIAGDPIWFHLDSRSLVWFRKGTQSGTIDPKTYWDARDACLSITASPVVLRIPSQKEWGELVKGGIEMIHPALNGNIWTSTIGSPSIISMRPRPFSTSDGFYLNTVSVKDKTVHSVNAAGNMAQYVCVGQSDQVAKAMTIREFTGTHFSRISCDQSHVEPSQSRIEEMTSDYGKVVCGNGATTVAVSKNFSCSCQIPNGELCMRWVHYSVDYQCH